MARSPREEHKVIEVEWDENKENDGKEECCNNET